MSNQKLVRVSLLIMATFALYSCNPRQDSENVQTFIYDIDDSNPNGQTLISLEVPELTRRVLDYDAVLVYLKDKATKSYLQVAGMGNGSDHVIRAFMGENDDVGYIGINFFDRAGGTNSTYSLQYSAVKVVIIKSDKTVRRFQ